MMNDEPLPVIAPAHVKYLGAKAHLFVCFIHSYPRAKARGNESSIRVVCHVMNLRCHDLQVVDSFQQSIRALAQHLGNDCPFSGEEQV